MTPLHFGARYDYFPYQRVTFSDNADVVCFQFNWLLLVGTLLQETSDFNSTAKCEQPYLRTTKGCELFWGGARSKSKEWTCKYLRVIQVWTGNNLQWLQRAPVIHMKKEVFLLGSNRANPSLQRSIGKKRLYFNMYDSAVLKWSIKKHRLMFLLLYCQ